MSNDNLFESLRLKENEEIQKKINIKEKEEEEKEREIKEYQKKINERIYSCCIVSGMIYNEISKNKKYKPKEEKGSILKMLYVLRDKEEIIESITRQYTQICVLGIQIYH